MKSLVIFDLDGTLLNTIDDLGHAVNYALGQMGYAGHLIEAYPRMVGNGVRRLIERALPPDACNPQIVDRLLTHFRKYYDEHCCDLTQPYPGIPELLAELTSRGYNLAVTSNKYQLATEKIIRHFFPQANWRAIYGQQAGVPAKPDPSVVFAALNACPTPKAEVMYVGDSGIDVETARRACVESTAVTWGFGSPADLRGADHVISAPAALLPLLQGN